MNESQQSAAQKLAEEVLEIHRHCPKDTQEEKERCERIKELAKLARIVTPCTLDYDPEQDDKSFGAGC